jgi:hypothetical protein
MMDRFTSAIKRVIQAVLPDFDLYAMHPATVIATAPNSVDVRPDNSRLPELVAVPLRTFAPNVQILASVDSRVLIAFEGGDRTKPVALLWGAGNFDALSIGSQNTQPVARVTDTTRGTIPANSIMVMTANGPATNPNPIPIKTTIETGSSKVRCE